MGGKSFIRYAFDAIWEVDTTNKVEKFIIRGGRSALMVASASAGVLISKWMHEYMVNKIRNEVMQERADLKSAKEELARVKAELAKLN